MRWLIAYDVAKPARLQRVYRWLCGHALPLQNSVFLLVGEQADLERCIAGLLPFLDKRADDVRVYPLPKGGLCKALGADCVPEGVWLAGVVG
ncbi:CRISPR-associated endonuclease Cas2 [Uruburuella testudinis]|uniref:CRISPR-associated endoribonuclease Cas2 n=1 Tax=Uruburuella testudinis TaxID=1282863 RepID=A0ABY4DRI7_9NEIS|nr:CRISPR-associated endonuclease Cas2 [Uruburuella testudinis]UOO81232.1 CRISPR-associated endonuclease Cas2 [Uruburuella testudinis]